jgi:hypothetical protein
MADNFPLTPGTGRKAATDDVTYSGEAADVQLVRLVGVTGAEGSKTVVEPPAVDETYGFPIDVKRTPATFAEDAAHASGDLGVQVLSVRRDTPAGSAGTAGDYQPPTTDDLGRTWVRSELKKVVAVTPTVSTTAYTAGDQVGGVMPFAGMAHQNGGPGRIVGASLVSADTEFPPIELWLFRNSPTMVGSDNAAFDITDANMLTADFIGIIDLSAWRALTSGGVAYGMNGGFALGGAPMHYLCDTDDTAIYGVMVTRAAQTLASTSDFKVTLLTVLE